MSAGFKHTAAQVITSNRHMAATAIKGLNFNYSYIHIYIYIHTYIHTYIYVCVLKMLIKEKIVLYVTLTFFRVHFVVGRRELAKRVATLCTLT